MNSVLTPTLQRYFKPQEANGKGRGDIHATASNNHTAATERGVLLLGFDWGTNKTCLKGAFGGKHELATDQVIPTIVGYAKDGVVDGLLPENASLLFGEPAIHHRLHLNLVQPMVDGVIKDAEAARDFARYLRSLLDTSVGTEVRAVIGVPANADANARDSIREAVAGLFDRVILIPEPFLAAMGFRDESRLKDPDYVDPVRNSLFVDIGGGTTDFCLVQGYFPTPEEQVSLPFAGDKVDALLHAAIRKTYPDCELTTFKVRELKEKHSFVGTPAALGSRAGETEVPLLTLVALGGSNIGPGIVAAIALVVSLGVLNTYTGALAKLAASLGRDGDLPRWFARGAEAGGVPRRALALNGLVIAVYFVAVALTGFNLTPFILINTACMLAVYGLGMVAALRLLARFSIGWWFAVISVVLIAGLLVLAGVALIIPVAYVLVALVVKLVKRGNRGHVPSTL